MYESVFEKSAGEFQGVEMFQNVIANYVHYKTWLNGILP